MALSKGPSAAKSIWEAYEMYAGTSFVMRTGFLCFRINDFNGDSFFKNDLYRIFISRGQSDAEHQANMTLLTYFFASNYPTYFGSRDTVAMKGDPNMWVIPLIALIHDTGETVVGDIPDDGSLAHKLKGKRELKELNKLADKLNRYDAEEVKDGLKQFMDKSSDLYKALYALDKLEILLALSYLEKNNVKTSIFRGTRFLSKSDRKFWRHAASEDPLDTYATRFKYQMDNLNLPPHIKVPLLDVLYEAVTDARDGEFFPWWEKPFSSDITGK